MCAECTIPVVERESKSIRWWSNVAASIVGAAIWDALKPLFKPVALSALSFFGLMSATVKRLAPWKTWSDAVLTAMLITVSLLVPVLILLVGLARPRRRPLCEELASRFLEGRELQNSAPRHTATLEELDSWRRQFGQWLEGTLNFLRSKCSAQAAARSSTA